MLTDNKKQAIESFLLVKCRRDGCDGPWCGVQGKLATAFGYPTDYKAQKKIAEHHSAIKCLTGKLNDLAEEAICLDTLQQSARLTNSLGGIIACLYKKHFKPLPLEIKRGDEDFEQQLNTAIGSNKSFVITGEDGGIRVTSSGLETFDTFAICEVCFGGIKNDL